MKKITFTLMNLVAAVMMAVPASVSAKDVNPQSTPKHYSE